MSVIRKHVHKKMIPLDENNTLDLCRICLENGAKLPIFEMNEEENMDILRKLTLCLREKIKDIEGYPRFICDICNNILDSACNFINKYKETCKTLNSGVHIIKEEKEPLPNDSGYIAEEIDHIKNEICDSGSDNNDFSDNDNEFLAPVKLQIKVKVKRETDLVKRIKVNRNTNTKQVTNKIASSILEGQFSWNGDEWCLKSSNTNKYTDNKSKLLQLKSESIKRNRVKIEVPKIKKPIPPKLCDLCGEVFKDQDKLSIHKRKVHFRKAMKCPHCTKILSSKYYLNRHIKRKHVETKDFICAECGRGFAFKTELRSHNKSVHEKHLQPKKQYKCKFCTKVYKCAKSVIVHERSAHTGHRPAVCNVCTSSFYHEDYLKEHMRLHTGETPFKCPVCGRGYAQRCNMKSHLRIHRISELDSVTLGKLRPNYLRLLKA